MKKVETVHITDNLVELTSSTNCSETLIAFFRQKGVLDKDDEEVLLDKSRPSVRASKLYDLLQQKTGGYQVLLEGLKNTGQSGVHRVLSRRYTKGLNLSSSCKNRNGNVVVLCSPNWRMSCDKLKDTEDGRIQVVSFSPNNENITFCSEGASVFVVVVSGGDSILECLVKMSKIERGFVLVTEKSEHEVRTVITEKLVGPFNFLERIKVLSDSIEWPGLSKLFQHEIKEWADENGREWPHSDCPDGNLLLEAIRNLSPVEDNIDSVLEEPNFASVSPLELQSEDNQTKPKMVQVQSKFSSQKYIKGPPKLKEFLHSNKMIMIMSTIDMDVTLEKIRENLDIPAVFVKSENEFIELVGRLNSVKLFLLKCPSTPDVDLLTTVAFLTASNPGCAKIILLTQSKNLSELENICDLEITKDRISSADLSSQFQTELLHKHVKVQSGGEFVVRVKDVLDQAGLAQHQLQLEDENLLVKLIQDQDSPLFKSFPKKLSYHIPRCIRSSSVLSEKVIFEKDPNDIFVFTGIKRNRLSSYLVHSTSDICTNQVGKLSLSVNYIILNVIPNFDEICKLAKDKSVNWLHFEDGMFMLVKSRNGDMSTIHRSMEGMAEKNKLFTETEFITHLYSCVGKYGNSPAIISDRSGSGKSVLLQNIGRQILESDTGGKVVLFVIFSELIRLIKLRMTNSEQAPLEQHFEAGLLQLTTECGLSFASIFLRNLFQQNAEKRKIKLELMLDGFDEISSADQSLALKLLNLLHNSYKSTRIWITTKPHLLQKLENELHVTGFTIEPFDEKDQEHLLTSFWMSSTHENIDPDLVTEFTRHSLQIIKATLKDSKEDSICGVPMQCFLLAEVFQKDCHVFANRANWVEGSQPSLSLKVNSIKDLYEGLLRKKLRIFSDRVDRKTEPPHDIHTLTRIHIYLGLRLLFPRWAGFFKKILKIPVDSVGSPSLEDILSVGIVESTGSGSNQGIFPRFVHTTVAEYLVARFVLQILNSGVDYSPTEKNLHNIFLQEILETESVPLEVSKWKPLLIPADKFHHSAITFFLNSLIPFPSTPKLREENDFVPKREQVNACVFGDHDNLFNILTNSGENVKVDESSTLFVAVKRASVQFFSSLCSKFNHDAKKVKVRGILENGLTLFHSAVECREYSIVEHLLTSENLEILVKRCDRKIKDVVHALVFCSHNDPEWLIKEKLEVLERLAELQPELLEWRFGLEEENSRTPLLQEKVHVELILKLLELEVDLLAVDEKTKSTLLHSAAQHLNGEEYHRVVTTLSEKHLEQLLKMKEHETPVLHQIAKYLRSPEKDTVTLLLRLGADFRVIVPENGRNCLHVAAESGNIEAARLFLELGMQEQVNDIDLEELTPMNILMTTKTKTSENSEKFGKLLMDFGGRLSDKYAASFLHKVILESEFTSLSKVKFLVEVYEADVHVTDDDLNTPLHTCMKIESLNRLEITRILLAMGAASDVKALNVDGETPLEILIKVTPEPDEETMETLSLLEKYGAVKNSEEYAQQAFIYAIKGSSLWKWKYKEFEEFADKFVKEGAHFEEVEGKSNILHECALQEWTNGVRYLLLKLVANVNVRNEKGATPLHVFMESGEEDFEMVRLLLERGADVGAVDEDGHTPLEVGLEKWVQPLERLSLFVENGAVKGRPEVATMVLLDLVEERKDDVDDDEILSLAENMVSEEEGNVHFQNENGMSLLHLAARNGVRPMIKFLVQEGVDVNLKNKLGMSPMHSALRREDAKSDVLETVALLKELNANLLATDNKNRTMVSFCVMYQPLPVLKYFLESGLFPNVDIDKLAKEASSDMEVDCFKEVVLRMTPFVLSELIGRKGMKGGARRTGGGSYALLGSDVRTSDMDFSQIAEYFLDSKTKPFGLSKMSELEVRRFCNLVHLGAHDLKKMIDGGNVSSVIQQLVGPGFNKEMVSESENSGESAPPNLVETMGQAFYGSLSEAEEVDWGEDSLAVLTSDHLVGWEYMDFVDHLLEKGHSDIVDKSKGKLVNEVLSQACTTLWPGEKVLQLAEEVDDKSNTGEEEGEPVVDLKLDSIDELD